MSQVQTITPDFTAYPVWADRLAAFRGTIWQSAALHSIADEARRSGDTDYAWAAMAAGDGCEDSLRDLDQLIADDWANFNGHRVPADTFWRESSYAIDAGLGK